MASNSKGKTKRKSNAKTSDTKKSKGRTKSKAPSENKGKTKADDPRVSKSAPHPPAVQASNPKSKAQKPKETKTVVDTQEPKINEFKTKTSTTSKPKTQPHPASATMFTSHKPIETKITSETQASQEHPSTAKTQPRSEHKAEPHLASETKFLSQKPNETKATSEKQMPQKDHNKTNAHTTPKPNPQPPITHETKSNWQKPNEAKATPEKQTPQKDHDKTNAHTTPKPKPQPPITHETKSNWPKPSETKTAVDLRTLSENSSKVKTQSHPEPQTAPETQPLKITNDQPKAQPPVTESIKAQTPKPTITPPEELQETKTVTPTSSVQEKNKTSQSDSPLAETKTPTPHLTQHGIQNNGSEVEPVEDVNREALPTPAATNTHEEKPAQPPAPAEAPTETSVRPDELEPASNTVQPKAETPQTETSKNTPKNTQGTTQSSISENDPDDVELVEKLVSAYDRIRSQLSQVIVGQSDVVEQLLIALFANGHVILEGVPGLAKTLMISTLSKLLSLSFSRIQFTPDLMPSDITGTEVIEEDRGTGSRSLRFVQGPIFAHVVLADEINRTPPKTQAALLEAMQENQVTAAGFTHKLPQPFFVLATQNPIEQEGTYPLPEAQLDRFMFKVLVDYPSEEEEFEIVKMNTMPHALKMERPLTAREILTLQDIVRRVPCADHVLRYATQLTRATRVGRKNVPTFIQDYVGWGAGPRASQNLIVASKARAILRGRYFVSTEDVKAVALPVLRHRVLTNFNAEADGITSDDIVRQLLDVVPSDPTESMNESMAGRVFATDSSEVTTRSKLGFKKNRREKQQLETTHEQKNS